MKKRIVSKVLAGILASTMILGLAACGDDSNPGSSAPGSSTPGSSTPTSSTPTSSAPAEPTATPKPAPLSITVSVPSDDPEGEYYDKLVKEVNEYVNMDITWQHEALATYYDSLAQKIAAANVADVIVTGNPDATLIAAGDEGLFWDLAPYIDDPAYDNFAAIPEATWRALSNNGKIYFLPRSRTIAREGFGYRKDWADKLGLKISDPMTWDEFKDMLIAFTNDDPDGNGENDTIGLAVDAWTGVWNIVFAWFNVPTNWGLDANGDLIHYSQTEEYKKALAAIRELCDLGVVNSESVNGVPAWDDIAAGKVRTEMMATGKCGVMIQTLDDTRKAELGGGGLVEQGISTEDDPAIQLMGYVLTEAGNMEPHVKPNGGGYNGCIAITTKNIKTEEQLKQVLQFLNDYNDGACLNLIEYGWEGETYRLDENGYVDLNDADGNPVRDAKGIPVTWNYGFNQIPTYYTNNDVNPRPVTKAPVSSVIQVRENFLYEDDMKYLIADMGSGYVSETYTSAETGATLAEIISTAQSAYIKGEIDENGLDDALSRWLTAGGAKATEEMNALYHAAGN